MLILPADIMALLNVFASVFSRRTWRHVPILVVGAILAPGRRMVSSALRTMGLSQLRTFQMYHRVLNRAVWSNLSVSRILLGLLVATFAPTGPLVVGIDETIERRRGPKIAAAGIYRDPVRSSHSHFVKVNGLRWICLLCLAPPRADPMGRPHLGATVPHGAGTLRALRSAPPAPLHADHAVGTPTHPPRASPGIAGSRIDSSSSSAIAPTPPWSCWQPYAVWQRSSRACAWMHTCARLPRRILRSRSGDRAW